ncbi:MAG: hypothetical protein QOD52_1368 [Gaiellaceae bacterium]|nr:hypothetical protein [Gaiellaceae bacterium]
MNNEVDFTFGFSCWIVATGTPDFAEMTPKVSPAFTVQNRGPDAVVVVPAAVVVVEDTGLCGCVAAGDVVVAREVPACRPDRMSTMAIVAASRNAAGATYRRQSSRGTTSRMRSRSPA